MTIKEWFVSWFSPSPVFEGGKLPARAHNSDAGLDLYASSKTVIPPGETVVVPTGLRCSFLPGWVALIWDRSGMGAKGLHRFSGVIDSSYRGEWGVVLHNSTKETYVVRSGDRIAQVIFQRCWTGQPLCGTVIVDTERGSKGYGSTGK